MPPRKKKAARAADRRANIEPARGNRRGLRKRVLVIACVAIAVVLIAGGTIYYQSQVAPFQRSVITVDNTAVRMGYFLKRTKMAGSDPAAMLQQLTYEQIVKIMAPLYGIEASQSDVDQVLRSAAAASSANTTDNSTVTPLTDAQFKEWYRERLKATGLSDAEYKEIAHTNLLAAQLQSYLASNIPAKGEQVHLSVIVLGTSADASKAKARLDAGETFATVAREVSVDTQSKENGGDVGWIPRGILPYDSVIFQLGVGQVSDPVATDPNSPTTSQYVIFMVSEKDPNREIDANSMETLKSRALYNWLTQEIPQHTINYNFDANTAAWVNWQLAKMPNE
jgi:foldase protein PrsA